MDLSEIRPGERIIEILSPGTREPLGVRVSLLHIDDDRLKKLKRAMQDERSRMEMKGKIFKAENLEDNLNKLAFTAMTGWEWYNPTGSKGDEGFDPEAQATWNKEIPPFNQKHVFEVFEKLPWFRDQIGREMGDDEAFFPV